MCQHLRVSSQGYCLECGLELDMHIVEESYNEEKQYFEKLTNYQLLTKELEADRQILLFLDIDNTVLEAEAVQFEEGLISPGIQVLQKFYETTKDILEYAEYADKIQKFSFRLENTLIEAAFRPKIFAFIHEASKSCKIVLSTLATRNYAEIVRNALDPEGKCIIEIVTRENEEIKSLSLGTRKSPLLRERSLVFDDSSQAWENEKIAFFKSVCFGAYIGAQGFSNQSSPVLNSFEEKLSEIVVEKQLLAVCALINAMKLHNVTNCYEFLQLQQKEVFEGCIFYIPLNLSQYQVMAEGDYLESASFNGRQELLVQSINQFGGRVALNSQVKGITHIVYTTQLIMQYKQKLGISTMQKSEIKETLLVYGDERKETAITGYYFVDSRFILESCYLLRRQYEERAHLEFIEHQ